MINNIDRRQFVQRLGMGTMGLLVLDSCSTSSPDLILHNANIYTSNPSFPKSQAIAISNGKIMAVGNDRDILYLAGSKTRKLDIGGKTITPGFIDAHSHPASSGYEHLRNVDCDLRSIGEIQDAIKKSILIQTTWRLGFRF